MIQIDLKSQLAALRSLQGYSSDIRVDGSFPEAAVLVPLMADRDDVSVLLTRRAPHLTIHAGESAFPGGKRDPLDPDLMATALREAQEEVALRADQFEWLFTLDQRLTRTEIKMTPFVGMVPSGIELIPNPGEIDAIFSVPLPYFANQRNLRMIELPYRGGLIRSPCFTYGKHDIWGVTAMTLIDLVNKVFDAGVTLESNNRHSREWSRTR